jgi:hypothetical protein
MRDRKSAVRLLATLTAFGLPYLAIAPALAASSGADASAFEAFLKSAIQLLAGLAGLTATGFFVFGGFTYITSSGNPENLDKGKRTLTYSGLGLVITVAAFVLTNIVTSLAHNAFGS